MNDPVLRSGPMPAPSVEAEQIIRAMLEEVWNTRDQPDLGTIIARYHTVDFVDHSAPPGLDRGLDGVEATVRQFHQACPDGRIEVSAQYRGDNGIGTFVEFLGTHTGHLPGVPATGREVYLVRVRIDRVREGRIYDHQAGLGLMDLMRSLQAPLSALKKHSQRVAHHLEDESHFDDNARLRARVSPLRPRVAPRSNG